jgi:NodT family efflux transporter outer membrane factor (OMF) lipoprotein
MTVALFRLLASVLAATLTACTVGPDYQRPPAIVPASFKEDGWKIGEPKDTINRGAWWSVYDDPVLDRLEREIDISNQTLKASEAAYRQSRALVSEARAGLFPTVTGTGAADRSGFGGRGSSSSRGSGSGGQTFYSVQATGTWDLDVWGRIRRLVEGDVANAQASAADLASARLSAQALLATDYFFLRIADEQKRLLDTDAEGFARSLQIARNQYAVGVASASDVAIAETQLLSTQAQSIAVGSQRALLEHAIAVLVGKPPADFAVAPISLTTRIPVIPAGVPSTLLERRPDIARAERLMAAANAQIGVAEAALYPDITLSASYAYQGFNLGTLIQAANKVWSVGPQLTQTLFDGGLRSAQIDQARAVYDQNVALYRETVLTGFQQVEDELSTLRILAQQAEVQANAVKSAQLAERLTLNQYLAGTVNYTTVVTAQATALANQLTALGILQTRLAASVALINALGGGWDASELPGAAQIKEGAPADVNRVPPMNPAPSS